MHKRLYRSHQDRKVFGILGGLGEYLEVDPTVVRLVYVALMFMTGVAPLLLGYLLGFFIIPPPGGDEEG